MSNISNLRIKPCSFQLIMCLLSYKYLLIAFSSLGLNPQYSSFAHDSRNQRLYWGQYAAHNWHWPEINYRKLASLQFYSRLLSLSIYVCWSLSFILSCKFFTNPRRETAGVSVRQPRQCSAGHGYGRCRASLRPWPGLVQCLGPYLVCVNSRASNRLIEGNMYDSLKCSKWFEWRLMYSMLDSWQRWDSKKDWLFN